MSDRDRLIELITKEVPRPKADALAGWLLANGVIVPLPKPSKEEAEAKLKELGKNG